MTLARRSRPNVKKRVFAMVYHRLLSSNLNVIIYILAIRKSFLSVFDEPKRIFDINQCVRDRRLPGVAMLISFYCTSSIKVFTLFSRLCLCLLY